MAKQRVIVYEMKDGSEEVFPLHTVEDEQHERAQAEREMHTSDTSVAGYHFEYREGGMEVAYQQAWQNMDASVKIMRPIEQIDRELKGVQSVECVENGCDSIDRNACGHVTEINHEVPEDSIYPSRPRGDVCPCRCHTLYSERNTTLQARTDYYS